MADLFSSQHRCFARLPGLALFLGLGGLVGAGACAGAAEPRTDNSPEGERPPEQGGGGAESFGGVGGGSSPSGDFDGCATSTEEATLVPLNMILMFDRSGSMQDNSKWRHATAALKAFVQDPESAGLRVALRFFPDDECNDLTCDIDACSAPRIEVAALTDQSGAGDPQEQALVDAIDGASANGKATPIYPALGGAEQWATDYRSAHPTEKAIVLLVTDGEPNGCNEDTASIAGLASQANATHGVLTYALGLAGSKEDVMNEIAWEGGTGQGIFIGNGAAQADLLAALRAIQGSQVACVFQMPQSDTGAELDPGLINVKYTSGGGVDTTLGRVAGENACSPRTGGWYYDDPSRPGAISFCPSTCQVVQADVRARIEIVVGCMTKPA